MEKLRAQAPRPQLRALAIIVQMRSDYILTLSCPDRTGIVYRVTGLLFDLACNILDAQQFGDDESGRFFLRVHFNKPQATEIAGLERRFALLADEFQMQWQLHDARRRARLLVLVSKQGIASTICCSACIAGNCRWTSPRWSPTTPTSRRWRPPTASPSTICR